MCSAARSVERDREEDLSYGMPRGLFLTTISDTAVALRSLQQIGGLESKTVLLWQQER